MIGANVAALADKIAGEHLEGGGWQWGVRVTPAVGIILLAIIYFVLEEPERAQAEHAGSMRTTPFLEDMKYLMRK